jgi:hypothetical protein
MNAERSAIVFGRFAAVKTSAIACACGSLCCGPRRTVIALWRAATPVVSLLARAKSALVFRIAAPRATEARHFLAGLDDKVVTTDRTLFRRWWRQILGSTHLTPEKGMVDAALVFGSPFVAAGPTAKPSLCGGDRFKGIATLDAYPTRTCHLRRGRASDRAEPGVCAFAGVERLSTGSADRAMQGSFHCTLALARAVLASPIPGSRVTLSATGAGRSKAAGLGVTDLRAEAARRRRTRREYDAALLALPFRQRVRRSSRGPQPASVKARLRAILSWAFRPVTERLRTDQTACRFARLFLSTQATTARAVCLCLRRTEAKLTGACRTSGVQVVRLSALSCLHVSLMPCNMFARKQRVSCLKG